MKRWLVVVLLGSIAVFAQEGLRADANSAAEEEVRKLETELAQMIVKGEWDRYAACLMDDFERTRGNGGQGGHAGASAIGGGQDSRCLFRGLEDTGVWRHGGRQRALRAGGAPQWASGYILHP